MAAPEWMKDVADSFVPDISGRKKAAAQAAKDKADAAEARRQAAADAAQAAAKKQVADIQFKAGGRVTGFKGYGKARKV